jgi:hypothetical protein
MDMDSLNFIFIFGIKTGFPLIFQIRESGCLQYLTATSHVGLVMPSAGPYFSVKFSAVILLADSPKL